MDDVGIFDAGDDLHGIAAGLAGFDIDAEYALEPLGPCHGGMALGRGLVLCHMVIVVLRRSRRYDDGTLSQLAMLSSAVKCECPRHLAELITSLSGFERYSAECESRSPRDAELHA